MEWCGHQFSGTNLSQEKLQLIQDAVLGQCDALDGVKDGLIADPRRCKFDPKKLLCSGEDTANCLTAAQLSAVEKVYSGPINPRTGAKLYEGMYPGNELGWGKEGRMMVINRTETSGVSSSDFMRYALFGNPAWEFRTFDFDRDAQAIDEKFAAIMNATDANLEEFRKLGHKLLYYHGAADPLVPAQNGIDYYESVQEEGLRENTVVLSSLSGPRALPLRRWPWRQRLRHVKSGFFYRSRSRHCERDRALGRGRRGAREIIATKYVDNSPSKGVAFQRPLCPYPLAARYKGQGDSNDAANWTCVK